MMESDEFEFLPDLFLRAPFDSFETYSPARLPAVLREPDFQLALRLASPVFYGSLRAKGFDYEQLEPKARYTLLKYYNRMCYRPTPFGAFASFSHLSWSGPVPVLLSPDERAVLHLRPDRERSATRFRPERPFDAETLLIKNPTLYRFGEDFRFLSMAEGAKGRYQFTIDAIEAPRFNRELLALLDAGPRHAGELETWIAAKVNCTPEAAREYLRFLVEDQCLYTPDQGRLIEPAVVPSAAQEMIGGDAYYAAAERPLVAGGLPPGDQAQIRKAVQVLDQLALPAPLTALEKFRSDFLARFDLEKVPLLLALDPDAGLKYGDRVPYAGNDAMTDIAFPAAADQPLNAPSASRDFLLKLWLNAPGRAWNDPIRISDRDLEQLALPGSAGMPPSAAVMFRKTEAGLLIESIGGSSAIQLIARFSIFSEQTTDLAQRIAEQEQAANPEVIFADIEQLSDRHIDNINVRRQVYPYVIPLNVYSAVPAGRQLLPEDLLLSVRAGELILESRRLGKRVIPRLASAYNYHHNETPLFSLLGDLQFQHLNPQLGLSLADRIPGLAYYPRVYYRQVILSPARWQLNAAEVTRLSAELDAPAGRPDGLIRALQLPKLISVGLQDQQLVIDLDCMADRDLLRRWLKNRDSLTLSEYLLPDRSAQSSGRALAAQYVAFIIRRQPVYRGTPPDLHALRAVKRQFLPGSDWLYLKIYGTPASANILLDQAIFPVVKSHRLRIRSWFFIRYADPQPHIRVRVRVKGREVGQILVAFHRQLNSKNVAPLISGVVCDTYQRELERYGPRYMEAVESVFRAGSELAAELIQTQADQEDPGAEFGFGLATAEQMIRLYYPEPELAVAFVRDVQERFLAEFKADKDFRLELDQQYRRLRSDIAGWLDGTADQPAVESARSALLTQLQHLARLIPRRATEVRRQMLADLIHMQMNRTFRQRQREQELLVYYHLHKYFKGRHARQK